MVGRLGVMAIDTATGRRIGFDPHGRYAMCSVFKLPLAAFVLRLCDQRALDPLDNSPVVEANMRRGGLTVEALAGAIVQQSDNSAANLLLRRVGGPPALTRFIRSCRDNATRVDRYEMALNSNVTGDPRDTTTPLAMAEFARTVFLGRVLTPTAVRKLTDWLATSVAKPDRLAAGFPASWKVGHKPGTGRNGAANDVAIVWPPRRPPIIVASFISGGAASQETRAAAHRAVAGVAAKAFT